MLSSNIKVKRNNMDQVLVIEKLNELRKIWREVAKQSKSLHRESRRLEHLIEFLKLQNDAYEFIFALLSLNVSIDKIYQAIFGWSY